MTPEEALERIGKVMTSDQDARLEIAAILADVQPRKGVFLTPSDCRRALRWYERVPAGTFDPEGGLLASELEAALS